MRVSQALGVLTKVLMLYHMNANDYISESKLNSYKILLIITTNI